MENLKKRCSEGISARDGGAVLFTEREEYAKKEKV